MKQNILKIFKNREINHVFFKKIAENNFEIKFKTSNEEKIYKIINEIRKNLSGVILFDEITIDKKENTLSIKLIFRVFYPSENLRKHIYINKISKENICEIFHLEKPKKYQLNGILHYDIAYINGEPFHVGDTIGGCQISDIQDEFITIKNGKNSIQINIDDRW